MPKKSSGTASRCPGSEASRRTGTPQFDLYRHRNERLFVDLQTDLIGIDASRIVAPLRDAARYAAFPGLTPAVDAEGTTWIVRVQELAGVPGTELRDRAGSLAEHRDALKRALAILMDGI